MRSCIACALFSQWTLSRAVRDENVFDSEKLSAHAFHKQETHKQVTISGTEQVAMPSWGDAQKTRVARVASGRLRWMYLVLAVGFELAGWVLMKYSIGFRSLKTLAAIAIAVSCIVASCLQLLSSGPLSDAWAWLTQLEYVGITLLGLFYFEERVNKVTIFALGLGMLGVLGFDMNGNGNSQMHPNNVSSTCSVLACSSAALVIVASYLAAQCVKWEYTWTVWSTRYLSLLTAVLFEVLTAIMLKSQMPLTSLLCAWASSACGLVMLEFMDLSCAWAIFTGLEYVLVEFAAGYLFNESFSVIESWAVAATLVSVVLLALDDSDFFHSPTSAPHLKDRINHIRRHIDAVREKGSRAAVLIGAGLVGKLVLNRLLSDCDDFKSISCVVVIDEGVAPVIMPPGLWKPVFHLQCSVAEDCLKDYLSLGLKPGDIVVELGHGISTSSLVAWCYEHGLHAVNARVSHWGKLDCQVPLDEQVEQLAKDLSTLPGPGATSVVLHGKNPGLVTYCMKKAVLDLGQRLNAVSSKRPGLCENEQIQAVAGELGVHRIDITEVDTQEMSKEIARRDFVSTQSCVRFFEEVAKAESVYHSTQHGGSQRTGRVPLANMGTSATFTESMEKFKGYVVGHEEVHTTPRMFPELEDLEVRFVYRPSQQMTESLNRSAHLSCQTLRTARNLRMVDASTAADSYNSVGAFVGTRGGSGQWCGLKCSASAAWECAGEQGNATSWLAAWGVLLGIQICMEHPHHGACLPEDLPISWILPHIAKHLISEAADELDADTSVG
mmetsp:Transcript_62237/g.181778  ORF Transcript_62237/g.181778 Transcript_62237/m.181778 type:complete len:779 (-) Transcript_62237:77-2413(-)